MEQYSIEDSFEFKQNYLRFLFKEHAELQILKLASENCKNLIFELKTDIAQIKSTLNDQIIG